MYAIMNTYIYVHEFTAAGAHLLRVHAHSKYEYVYVFMCICMDVI